MRIIYHPAARVDVLKTMEYYEEQEGAGLAADFFAELLHSIGQIAVRPKSFRRESERLRRSNLHRFPYHILFEMLSDNTIQILVVKHDRRDPSFGLER